IVMNCTPNTYDNYKIGVPSDCDYQEVLNSDRDIYGGSNRINPFILKSSPEDWKNEKNVIFLTIPPLGISILKAVPKPKEKIKKTTVSKKKQQ
nr:alpha amylase C-terminal domain-containing protein [Anaeroplasmataceae bacterium]